MSEELAFAECDRLVREFEQVVKKPVKKRSSIYYTGVDLGTACVVLAVLDENRRPVAGAYRYADVVRDGMVVDYIGAIRLVREMKEELEEKYGVSVLPANCEQLRTEDIHNMQPQPFLREPTLWTGEQSKM